ncbi:MAG TPA: prephenate dehydratase domain-containing protein, partial [Sphingomicrobium sp.]|nr:prephenate dehydratase domain-containing protein [Sphingomicrobium sp.]
LLAIRMHLLGLPDASLDQIRTVVSHPVALRQCAATLAALGVGTEETSNTAVAAKALTNPMRGVLASEAAATLYGLSILKRDVHDRPDNATRFAIVSRDSQ